MRQFIASVLRDYLNFSRNHRFLGVLLSLVIFAACIGGIYLIIANFTSFMPCLTASCG